MKASLESSLLGGVIAPRSRPGSPGGARPDPRRLPATGFGWHAAKSSLTEETGKVPESLAHLADDYEEQVAIMVKNTGHLIQPLLVLILGWIVLFIILAVSLPYIQVLTSLAGP